MGRLTKLRMPETMKIAVEYAIRAEHSMKRETGNTEPSVFSVARIATCSFCHRRGHTEETCFKKQRRADTQASGATKMAETRECYYCRKVGHVMRDCEARKDGKPRVPAPEKKEGNYSASKQAPSERR